MVVAVTLVTLNIPDWRSHRNRQNRDFSEMFECFCGNRRHACAMTIARLVSWAQLVLNSMTNFCTKAENLSHYSTIVTNGRITMCSLRRALSDVQGLLAGRPTVYTVSTICRCLDDWLLVISLSHSHTTSFSLRFSKTVTAVRYVSQSLQTSLTSPLTRHSVYRQINEFRLLVNLRSLVSARRSLPRLLAKPIVACNSPITARKSHGDAPSRHVRMSLAVSAWS